MDLSSFFPKRRTPALQPRTAQQLFDEWRGQCIGIWADIELQLARLHAHFIGEERVEADGPVFLTGARIELLCKAIATADRRVRPENKLLPKLEELRGFLPTRNCLAHATGTVAMHGERWLWALEMRTTNSNSSAQRSWIRQDEAGHHKAALTRLRQGIEANVDNLLGAN